MDIEPPFKRRHFGTPQSMMLIVANFVTFTVILSLTNGKTGWFFWIGLALLALYNFFNIRKDRGEYNRARIIAYVISILALVGMYFLFRYKGYGA